MLKEKTLLLVKPDSHELGVAGEIIQRFLDEGFHIVAAKNTWPTPELVEEHYKEVFSERPHLRLSVTEFLTSGRVTAIVAERDNAVLRAREVMGPLFDAPKGTIRGDYGGDSLHSRVHGSDSPEAAEREIRLWFGKAPDSFVVVVTCVVLSRDERGEPEALILRRSEKEQEGPGLWCVPGGKMKIGDCVESVCAHNSRDLYADVLGRAISREVEEETGIRMDKKTYSLINGEDLVFTRKSGEQTLVLTFLVSCETRPAVTLSKDNVEYKWIGKEDLSNYKFIGKTGESILKAFQS